MSRPRPLTIPPQSASDRHASDRHASNRQPPSASQEPAPGPRLPPLSASRFLNAGTDAHYIGKDACARCHEEQHRSYLHTAHSRALEDIDLAREPPDAQFDHSASGRRYSVFRDENEYRHREELRTPDGRVVAAAEHPMRYAIGSGHYSRSYLAEVDGFLVESPVTWYAAKGGWAMSPGYDHPRHHGFELIADFGCLQCHAGRVEPLDDNRYRVALHEGSIGCESCHGPGSLHAAKQAGKSYSGLGEEDLTIVHPARLTREESDSLCAQCHLRGAATVTVRNRRPLDFRPGLRLADFRIDFVPQKTTDTMSVVGHVEQMRASPCYQKSDSLTCTTCHDPHAPVQPEQQLAYYRDRCNACHDGNCGLDRQERLQRSEEDNCAACHMPQRPTDLPHFAFTHHRIGLHSSEAAPEESSHPNDVLVPLSDLQPFAPADRQRLRGLAYMEYFGLQPSAATPAAVARARQLLEDADSGGAGTADVHATLARLDWERGQFASAIGRAARALAQPDLASGAHADALFVIGDSYRNLGNYPAAEDAFVRLAGQRRMAEPWALAGLCRLESGDVAGAVEAYHTAAQIDPFRWDVQQQLMECYRALGQLDVAKRHGELAAQLRAAAP